MRSTTKLFRVLFESSKKACLRVKRDEWRGWNKLALGIQKVKEKGKNKEHLGQLRANGKEEPNQVWGASLNLFV